MRDWYAERNELARECADLRDELATARAERDAATTDAAHQFVERAVIESQRPEPARLRRRFEALARLLVVEGHATPQAFVLIMRVLDDEGITDDEGAGDAADGGEQ